MPNELIIILIVVGVLLVLFFLTLLVIYKMTFYNELKNVDVTYNILQGKEYEPFADEMTKIIDNAVKIKFTEEVKIVSFDGKTLYGKYYHQKDGAPISIQFHGYKGNGARDFSGGLCICLDRGYNVLVVDQRGHAKSFGRTITFGIKESKDVLSWINYVNERFGGNTPIFLYGVSMGGATVIMATGRGLPKNVKGVLADCPYSSPKDVILNTVKKMKLSPKFFYPFILLSARIFAGVNLLEITASEAVKTTTVPVLIVHGETDTLVPIEMSREIQRANPDMVTHVSFPNAPHGMSYVTDKEKYLKAIDDFSKKIYQE